MRRVNDEPNNPPPGPTPNPGQPNPGQPNSGQPNPFHDERPQTGQFQHQPVSARVPDRVARGVYCTGQVILDSPKEFIVDFLNAMTRPHQVVARVVLHPQTMAEFARALAQNIQVYKGNFGDPPPLPPPPTDRRPTIQEIYENFRVPEDLMSGAYANSVLIGHSPTEFFFDFITGFYPTSAVSSRVFLPAAQAPRFLTTINASLQQYQARYQKPPQGPDDGPQ
jgi:hypothetical protein